MLDGCFGEAGIEFEFESPPPENVRVEWNAMRVGSERLVEANECENDLGTLFIGRNETSLFLSRSGFGYSAPVSVAVRVEDQGACAGEDPILVVDETVDLFESTTSDSAGCSTAEVRVPVTPPGD